MFIRVNRIQQNGKSYQYADLVESFRRESDGRPAHRVIKALGRLSDAEIESWRATVSALESGEHVVVAPKLAPGVKPQAPQANLKYLHIAVLLELFRNWDLQALCSSLIGTEVVDVEPGAVVAALAIQRCVEPGSKLFASRWIPGTALPELLGVAPESFNNTRIHRVLDGLCEVDDALQQVLATRYRGRDGNAAFASLFLDTSEATFEGTGPALAEKSRTKDGVFKRRIGISLLCNERGYPLRWEVLRGKSADCNTFVDVCQRLADVSWAKDVPLIMDRAAGTTDIIGQLLDTNLHIVTALVATEKPNYAPTLPCDALNDIDVSAPDAARTLAANRVKSAGLTQVTDDLLMRDLGIVEYSAPTSEPTARVETELGDLPARIRQALQVAHSVDASVQEGTHRSIAAAARARGLSKELVGKYRALLGLVPEIRAEILAERSGRATIDGLRRIAKLPAEQQLSAFDALNRGLTPKPPKPTTASGQPLRVRVVAYFNPDLFVDKRTSALRTLATAHSEIASINARMLKSPKRWTQAKAAAAVDRQLRRLQVLDVFAARVNKRTVLDRESLEVELVLNEEKWAKRRRYDGFTVLVAHPELTTPADELCRLYRERELVEHDFRVIKSLIELQPVRHRLDHKVKAHVTICMLALLLERTLRQTLGATATSERALEDLATCHLNYFGKDGYAITLPTPEQRRLLKALTFEHLIDTTEVDRRITPR